MMNHPIEILAIFLVIFILNGCGATHIVSANRVWNAVTLIDSDGRLYEGKTVFNVVAHDGTLEFPDSPYGPLDGKFSTVTPSAQSTQSGMAVATNGSQTVLVPIISSQKITMGNSKGSAYLASNGIVVLRCNIGVDFVSVMYDRWHMVGGGICHDNDGKISHLMFDT